jgi:glycerol-3-phosphate dehydrogenase
MSKNAPAHAPSLERDRLLERLRSDDYPDILVIGGGATGLGCAVDAASRGHSVVLVEAHDFAKGTSSRATKLIHGGVRYLAQGKLALVREALIERSRLLHNAPHLVRPLRFVVPAYRWFDRPRFAIGLALYDLMSGMHGIHPCSLLDHEETAAALPTLARTALRGGVAYWDAQFDDARLAITLMRTVLDLGGLAINYMPVEDLLLEAGRVVGARVRDAESGEQFAIRARVVINATGVWADNLRRMERPRSEALLRPSQGVHLVVDRSFFPGPDALLVPETRDGRVLFVIPWQGRALVGTTDTAREDAPIDPVPLAGEVDFILDGVGQYLSRAPRRADVRSVYAGLRPLIGSRRGVSTAGLSREHLVDRSAGGLITITGGKWTTYRQMAEDAVNAAEACAGLSSRPCVTADLRLHGATTRTGADAYGSERDLIDTLPGAGRRIHEGLTLSEAEVRHAVRHELARTLEDVLARRHRALFMDAGIALAAAPAVARVLAAELRRDRVWCDAETARFRALAAGFLADGRSAA